MTQTYARRQSLILCACLFTTFSSPASAQTTTVRDVLAFLMTTQAVRTGDFVKDREAAEATGDTVARALLIEMATLPLPTSQGAFSYRFNPAIGTVERAVQSFGPMFVDRMTTGGQGQASLSITYRGSDFATLSGRNLRNGAFTTVSNKFLDEPSAFDVEELALKLRAQTLTLSGTFGVTDAIDVGIAVPIVHVALSGERVNTYRGTTFIQATGTASSGGIGDVSVRSKFQLVRRNAAGLGADVEVRIPSGSVENLRGAGRAALKTALVASLGSEAFETHANLGIVRGGVSSEAAFSGAISMALAPRLTLSAEALLRRIEQLRDIQEASQPHPTIANVQTTRLLPSGNGTTTALGVAGMRWNLAGSWLLNAYVLVPLTGNGLRARAAPAISVEYSLFP